MPKDIVSSTIGELDDEMNIDLDAVRKDEAFKSFFKYKSIASTLLKLTVTDLKDYTVEQIADSIVDTNTRNASTLAERIHSEIDLLNSDDGDIKEKIIRYDLLFTLKLPDKDKADRVDITFDLEMQQEKPSEYSLVTRAMYYVASLLRDTIKSKGQYSDIHKVYSIWICDCKPIFDSDEADIKDRYLHKYRTTRVYEGSENTADVVYKYDKNADLMEVIMIELKKISAHLHDELAEFLNSVFNDLKVLPDVMEKYTEAPIHNTTIEGVRSEMLSREDYIAIAIKQGTKQAELKGMKRGMEKGIEEGTEKGIAEGTEKGIAEAIKRYIKKKISKNAGISVNELAEDIADTFECDVSLAEKLITEVKKHLLSEENGVI